MYKEGWKNIDNLPTACVVAVGMFPNNEFTNSFLKHGFSVLDIKPLMIVTN